MFRKLFLNHPAEVGESYREHFGVASSFGMAMIIGGLGAMVHAIIPAFCKTTGSTTINRLHKRIVAARGSDRDARTIEWMI
jgi:Family of unknown function (DUF6356)